MRRENDLPESGHQPLPTRLREARLDANLTQLAAGEAVGVDPNTIARYEAGRIRPSSTALFALGQVYGKPVEWFFGEEEEPEPTPENSEEDIDIMDPSLSLFFRGEWDEFTEAEKAFVKGMIQHSRELLRKRREGG